MPTLYQDDLSKWLELQIRCLKDKDFESLDLIIEEMDALGKNLRHTFESYFRVMMIHMLKIEYQPEKRTRSWNASVRQINKLIKESPSLKHKLDEVIRSAYEDAVYGASQETGLLEEPLHAAVAA